MSNLLPLGQTKKAFERDGIKVNSINWSDFMMKSFQQLLFKRDDADA